MKFKGLLVLITISISSHFAFALNVGDQAPNVNIDQIAFDNTEVVHSVLDRNAKTLVLDFFSLPCSDCLDSFGPINKVAAQVGDAAYFRMSSVDRGEKLVRDFIAGNRDLILHEVALDFKREAFKAYGIVVTPTVFVVNANNTIIYKHEGGITPTVAAEIKQAMH